jgi:hypothetical protein
MTAPASREAAQALRVGGAPLLGNALAAARDPSSYSARWHADHSRLPPHLFLGAETEQWSMTAR